MPIYESLYKKKSNAENPCRQTPFTHTHTYTLIYSAIVYVKIP